MPPVRVSGTLAALFPADHPDSEWLFRLMVLRQDIAYEFEQLGLAEADGPQAVWRCSYFVRKISVSLDEVRCIFVTDVQKSINHSRDDAALGLAPHIAHVRRQVEASHAVLSPIRNGLGAHMRPQNADSSSPTVFADVLRAFPALAGQASIDLERISDSAFHELAVNALVFAWPDVTSDGDHETRQDALQKAIFNAVPKVMGAIDALLVRHWWHLGLLKPHAGYDFAVRGRRGKMKRISKAGP
jgi:hypothetical protein